MEDAGEELPIAATALPDADGAADCCRNFLA